MYERALVNRLSKQGINVICQHELKVHDEDGTELGVYYADLFIEDCLIVEIKAVRTIADEHVAQLYSSLPDGSDLQRHTDHDRFFVRFARTDGARVVYTCGADLWLHDPATGQSTTVAAEPASPQTWKQRMFVKAAPHVEDLDLHPAGHSLALTVRGRPCVMGNWEGPVRQLGRDQVGRGDAKL